MYQELLVEGIEVVKLKVGLLGSRALRTWMKLHARVD